MNIASKLFMGMMALAACAKRPVSGIATPGIATPDTATPVAAVPLAEGLDPIKPPAGVTVIHRVKSYAVTGTDRRSIRSQLRVPEGAIVVRNFAGLYEWQLSWRYQTGREGTLCRVTRATVTLTSSVTLPEWTPVAATDPAIEPEWKRFRRALAVHEQGHRDLAYAGAARVRRALEGVPLQPCASIASDVSRAAQPLLSAMKVEQARYDSTTRHGATQGATF